MQVKDCLSVLLLACASVINLADGRIGFYSLTAKDIEGNEVRFSDFKGKVVLVVNVASACGYTDRHYTELQRMYDILGDTDRLRIVAFPCNQFGEQEPWTNNKIKVLIR